MLFALRIVLNFTLNFRHTAHAQQVLHTLTKAVRGRHYTYRMMAESSNDSDAELEAKRLMK